MEGSQDSEQGSGHDADESHLIWRRLQLSKAKLKGVTEMAALMAGFSVVSKLSIKSIVNHDMPHFPKLSQLRKNHCVYKTQAYRFLLPFPLNYRSPPSS